MSDRSRTLVALARAQPGKLNWAGVTGALDFCSPDFLQHAGLNMTKVPYRNPVEAANDLAEGRVQAYLSALAIVRPQIEAGKIKPLAVTNKVRAPTAPDVPTVKEAGIPTSPSTASSVSSARRKCPTRCVSASLRTSAPSLRPTRRSGSA
jgi:tripartite-type tricarboxylate transporter receptor subunit TctC